MKPPVELQQERDFSQKINATFDFVIQNFKPLLRAVVFIAGPGALVAGFFGGLYQSNMLTVKDTLSGEPFGGLSKMLGMDYLLMVLFSVLSYLLAGCTVYAYVVEYEIDPQREISTEQVWARVQQSLLSYAGALMLGFVLLVGGSILLVIPAIYWMVVYSLVFFIVMRENIAPFDAIKRAFYLIKNKWWAHFGLILIMGIIQSIFNVVFQAPSLIATFLKTLGVVSGDLQFTLIATTMLSTVGSACVNTLGWVAIAFQYYNFVEQKEGSGMLAAINAIGQKQTPAPNQGEEQY